MCVCARAQTGWAPIHSAVFLLSVMSQSGGEKAVFCEGISSPEAITHNAQCPAECITHYARRPSDC